MLARSWTAGKKTEGRGKMTAEGNAKQRSERITRIKDFLKEKILSSL